MTETKNERKDPETPTPLEQRVASLEARLREVSKG